MTGATLVVRRRRRPRWGLYALAALISAFVLVPIYLIAVAAFSPQSDIYAFPKPLLPARLSADTMRFFLSFEGVGESLANSVLVGGATLVLSLLIGAPAGYGLARYVFRGHDAFQLLILATRAFPIVILAVPLAVAFIDWGLYDSIVAVALVHTALALPTTILTTGSIFVAVPRDVEEAALTLGCTPFGSLVRVVLPLALPGLAAASLFTFLLSWNEVFAAVMLTLSHRTLPALVLGALSVSPLPFRFAGGFALVVPSLVFVFFIRRYLFNLWGRVGR